MRLSVRTLVLVAIAAVVVLATYAGSFSNPFVWDDHSLITPSAALSVRQGVESAFDRGWGDRYFRPLQLASYALDRFCWGNLPEGFRIDALILFFLCCVSLYFLLRAWGISPLYAYGTALLFGVMPVNGAFVYYLSNRADVFAFLGMTVALSAYEYLLLTSRRRYFLVMLAAALFAFFSKESAYILPLLLLSRGWSKGIVKPRDAASFVLLAGVIVFRCGILSHSFPVDSIPQMVSRIPGFFAAIATYVRLLFFPYDLRFDYGSGYLLWSDWRVWAGIVIVCGWAVACWHSLRSGTRDRLYLLFFPAIAMIPTSNVFVPMYSYIGEHMVIFPSVALYVFFAKIAERADLFSRSQGRVLCGVYLASAMCVTVSQNAYWQDVESFYVRTIAHHEVNSGGYINLGWMYFSEKRYAEARQAMHDGVARFPFDGEMHRAKGRLHLLLKENQEALKYFRNAYMLGDRDVEFLNLFGIACALSGNPISAKRFFYEAAANDKAHSEPYQNLLHLLKKTNNKNK